MPKRHPERISGAVTRNPYIHGQFWLRDKWTARDFGVRMNGDEQTEELKKMFKVCNDYQRVAHIPEGVVGATETLTQENQSRLWIKGSMDGLSKIQHMLNDPLFFFLGTLDMIGELTEPAPIGSQSIQMNASDAAGLSKGSVIWIRDPTNLVIGSQGDVVAGARAVGGEQMIVHSVDDTTVYFYGQTCWPYSEGSDVRLADPGTGGIADLTIENVSNEGDTAVARGIYARYCRDLSLTRVRTIRMAGASFYIWGGFNDRITDCTIVEGQDAEQEDKGLGEDGKPQGPYPYGVYVGRGTSHLTISGLKMIYGRHAVSSASSPTEIPPQHILVENSTAQFTWHAAFDTHPGARWFTFSSCRVVSGSTTGIYDTDGDGNTDPSNLDGFGYGFQLRGPDCHVRNCEVIGAPVGVFFANAADRGSVTGGRYDRCQHGIRIRNSNEIRIGARVEITNPTHSGVYVEAPDYKWTAAARGEDYVQKLELDDVVVTGTPIGAAAYFEIGAWRNTFEITERFRIDGDMERTYGVDVPTSYISSEMNDVP